MRLAMKKTSPHALTFLVLTQSIVIQLRSKTIRHSITGHPSMQPLPSQIAPNLVLCGALSQSHISPERG